MAQLKGTTGKHKQENKIQLADHGAGVHDATAKRTVSQALTWVRACVRACVRAWISLDRDLTFSLDHQDTVFVLY